jgi:hypothetical protein
VPLQIHPSLFNPAVLWADLALKATEMMVSSAEVIGNRVDQIARAGANPSPRDMREIVLMGSEKVKAATESGLAVATRMQSQNLQIFTRAWQQWLTSLGAMAALATSRTFGEALARQHSLFNALSRSTRTHAQISGDTARLAHAAMKPVHAASTANAKRLRRAKKTRSTRR